MTLKKLLVLDVNGLLIDTYFHKEPLPEESPDARIGNFYVYKRPFCEEFLQFCLENFIVGIWSSAREYNVNNLVDYVFGDAKARLAFSWHQSDCTDVGLKAPDNEWKPLFMKELSKLWTKVKVGLPWSEGDYGPSNTLLVDDTPYKAVLNPPNTAIFPRSYTARDHGDTFLGGALRSYLEGIRDAASVQTYVEKNPFGEPSITPESPLWSHVSKVLLKVQSVLNEVSDEIAQVLPVEAVRDDSFKRGRRRRSRYRTRNGYSDQLTNDDTGLFEDFPSEAIELQFSEKVVPVESVVPSEEFHDLDTGNNLGHSGKELGVLLGPQEQSKDEQPVLESLHMDSGKNGRMKRGLSSFLQQEFQGVSEGAARGPLERGQPCTTEQTSYNSEQAQHNADVGMDVGLDDLQEQQDNEIDGHDDENGQKVCGNSGFNRSTYDLQVDDTDERPPKKQELITPRDDSFVHTASNCEGLYGHSTYSDGSRDKHRRFHEEPIKSHDKRKYNVRNSMDYSQSWKRQNGYFQDSFRHSNGYGQNWKGRRGYCQDGNKESIGYGQSWRRQRGCYQRGTTNMAPLNQRDQRRHFNNSEQSTYEADRGYRHRDTSFNSYVRHSQESHGDRPVDVSAGYSWGLSRVSNTRAPQNAVFNSNFSTQPYGRNGGFHMVAPELNAFGHIRDGVPSSYQRNRGFEPRLVHESSNICSERTEDLIIQGCQLDLTNREGGAPSEPCRNVGASSHSCRRGTGASRLPYKVLGASVQRHRSNNDRRRGWSPRDFSSRSRQSWDS